MTRQIDQREHQVAGFFGKLVLVAAVERGLDLVGFLADFAQHLARVVPVKTDAGSLALQVQRAPQGGLPGLDAGEQRLRQSLARAPGGALGLFFGLDALPRALDADRRQAAVLVGKNMRMPSDHLARDRLDDVAECEGVLFLGHAGVIDDLKQEIAQFIPEIVEIAAADRVRNLVGFLDGVGRDRRKILLEVPGAAGDGRAQRRHDLDQA